jgi:hypothetical protein
MCSAIKVKPSGLNGLPVHWSWRFSKRKNKFVRMNQAGVLGRSNLRAMLSALEKIFKNVRAKVSDVGKIVNSWATGIHLDASPFGVQRFE